MGKPSFYFEFALPFPVKKIIKNANDFEAT